MLAELSNWITASATVVLACLTAILALATIRMARAMAQPHVVANLESNQWSIRHMDLIVENCGNAPAYNVSISIDPPIELANAKGECPIPFSNISVIRPGQSIISFATDWEKVKDEKFRFHIKWTRLPNGKKFESLEYNIDMKNLDGISYLGRLNPAIQIAEEVKKIRDDWKPVASGTRKTKVDIFDTEDRNTEKKTREELMVARRAKRDGDAVD